MGLIFHTSLKDGFANYMVVSNGKMKTLIIEDQQYPLEALEAAVQSVGIKTCDLARWYTQAEQCVRQQQYDLVLLDHRMPYDDPGCTDTSDFGRFSQSLQEVGYSLIPLIRERSPAAIIVGTSSQKVRNSPQPDYTISKMYGEAEEDLLKILRALEK